MDGNAASFTDIYNDLFSVTSDDANTLSTIDLSQVDFSAFLAPEQSFFPRTTTTIPPPIPLPTSTPTQAPLTSLQCDAPSCLTGSESAPSPSPASSRKGKPKKCLDVPVPEHVLRLPLREFKAEMSSLSQSDRTKARAARRALQNRDATGAMRDRVRHKLQMLDTLVDDKLQAVLAIVGERASEHFSEHPALSNFLSRLSTDLVQAFQPKTDAMEM